MIRSFLFLLLCLPGRVFMAQGVDTIAPQVHCITDVISMPLWAAGMAEIYGLDLVDSFSDNSSVVWLTLRQVCLGPNVPSTFQEKVYDYGIYRFEVQAQDLAGNTATCETSVLLVTGGATDPASGYTVQTSTVDTLALPGVKVWFEFNHCYFGQYTQVVNTSSPMQPNFPYASYTDYGEIARKGTDIRAVPRKDTEPLNGVSTADLLLIQRHVLGLQPFTKQWQWVAADANLDGKVTSFDVVLLRKLVLGLTPTLPHGRSWRFWPSNYLFNAANPLMPAFPEEFYAEKVSTVPFLFTFTGVKIGDVDGSADPDQ